eukprot:CAMPEP_0182565764 /NCGR_PEP_ID=MMETSP1324-20130603/7414_1 /TAXON_ID=236786 /ORGANISM="Florenciella sp., Strain RCC1587" /LENGTH=54 /DNA_ID=CAMNT_0024779471 /DNA_START=165 /DNA_END=326 /DNA_ORIENTATION=+
MSLTPSPSFALVAKCKQPFCAAHVSTSACSTERFSSRSLLLPASAISTSGEPLL